MSVTPSQGGSAGARAAESGRTSGAGLLLALLTLAYLLSFFDRQLLIIMVEHLKRDLDISDTQFSLLYGFAFTTVYAAVGVIFGFAVDRLSRTRLLGAAILIWSLGTLLSAFAHDFPQLVAARMVVGVGEGALAPAAYSLIADLYASARRSRAFSLYSTGLFMGSGLSLFVGGQLLSALDHTPLRHLPIVGDVRPWQLIFLCAGPPGILLAAAFLLVREPPRGAQDLNGLSAAPREALGYLKHFIAHKAAYLRHHLGFGLHTGVGFAVTIWMPAVFLRAHHWSPLKTGMTLGLLSASCGILGALVSGVVVEALLKRRVSDAMLRISAINCFLLPFAVAGASLSRQDGWALAGSAAAYFLIAFTPPQAGASLSLITPPHLRGRAGAVFFLMSQLLGVSLVPLLVAMATQRVLHNPARVGTSLAVIAFATLVPAGLALWSARSQFRVPGAAT